MNLPKTHCPWCKQNKHPEKHQTFTPVARRETDVPQNTETYLEQSGEQSGGGLTHEGEGSYGGIPEYDQDLDEDFQPVEQDDVQEPGLEVEQDEVEELGNDSDAEPIPETTATPPADGHPYATDITRRLPDRYQARQPRTFVTHVVWEPVKLFNANNERIYSEMNTASWWWDQQSYSGLFPSALHWSPPFGVDQTYLTNFSGTRNYGPIHEYREYKVQRTKQTDDERLDPIALLPTPPKRLAKVPGNPMEAQELDALQVTHEILAPYSVP
ncbi:hypothetical protein BGX38DRAFT_1272391 [Terfezia claveryi]|nr:hypothetical protein BGX38DRAFT_1272391 [Terfezia claveryi]